MKKILVFVTILLMTAPCYGNATQYNLGAKNTPIPSDWFRTGRYKDFGTNWARDIDALVELGQSPGIGSVYYVNSNVTNEGDGTSWDNARDTLDEAINLCDGNDFIYVAQGHAETMGAAADEVDVDVQGLTIIGLGSGSLAPAFTYTGTATGAFAIGAPGVTIVNFQFIAGVSDVNEAIDVEAAGDYFTLAYCRFPKPTTNSFEFLDTIDVISGATYIKVVGCYAQNDDAGAAPNHFIDLGNAALVGIHLEDNVIFGDFAVAAIWSNDADTEVYIVNNTVTNMTSAQHCIEFTGNATGICVGNIMYTDAEATTLDPGYLKCFGNYVTTAVDKSGMLIPVVDDGLSAFNATTLTAIEGEATDALEADHIDHLFAASVADEIANDSFAADLVSKSSTSDWSDYDKTTDSLEAQADELERCVTKSLTSIVNGNNNLFVVAGGPIQIIEIIGIVTTTAIEAKSCLINYNMDPTTPAGDTVFGTDGTALEINGDAVGALYTWDGVIANDLTATDNGVALGVAAPTLIVPAGSLELAVVVATSATGQIDFYLRYKPLVPGAIVTAAP